MIKKNEKVHSAPRYKNLLAISGAHFPHLPLMPPAAIETFFFFKLLLGGRGFSPALRQQNQKYTENSGNKIILNREKDAVIFRNTGNAVSVAAVHQN